MLQCRLIELMLPSSKAATVALSCGIWLEVFNKSPKLLVLLVSYDVLVEHDMSHDVLVEHDMFLCCWVVSFVFQ